MARVRAALPRAFCAGAFFAMGGTIVRETVRYGAPVKVVLRNPRREVQLSGPLLVSAVLERLEINPETVIVIRGDTLLTKDQAVADDDVIELRPVISGGSLGGPR